eukprot:TRINITY_DN2012_c0_g1_i3.p1 TRINITY_DN2012_c0_g1~~TRINITY_DN2012_c0_g1_i3.p1  ORF type:complete len:224 (-),score=31.46 TRINITY_DN2012_c0_g1_i3:70-741(-)
MMGLRDRARRIPTAQKVVMAFGVLLPTIATFVIIYISDVYPDVHARSSFAKIDCTVLDRTKFSVSSGLKYKYLPCIKVEFSYGAQIPCDSNTTDSNNETLSCDHKYVTLAQDTILSYFADSDPAPVSNYLEKFSVGQVYPCYLDPKSLQPSEDDTMAPVPYVVMGFHVPGWNIAGLIIFPSIICLFALFSFLRTAQRAQQRGDFGNPPPPAHARPGGAGGAVL